MKTAKRLLLLAILLGFASLGFAGQKPKLTLDEFFNSVSYTSVALSPDGNSLVIGTERADWDQQIFRTDLWLYRDDGKGGSLIQLTQSGSTAIPSGHPMVIGSRSSRSVRLLPQRIQVPIQIQMTTKMLTKGM